MKEKALALAFETLKNAYCPYSHFPVAAVVYCKDGQLYKGVNVENAAYPSGMCAERVALFNAISDGQNNTSIEGVVIVTKAKTISYSCAACRQVFVELLNDETPIIFNNGENEHMLTVKELVPYPFKAKDLE